MRVAIYARFSSDNQREASIEDQIRLCNRHIDQQSYTLVNCYSDYAMSGASLNRPGIQSLQEDANRGQFDLVITEALDRLSRDQEDIAGLYKRLSFANVKIITLAEGEVNELHVGLKGTMNSLFLKDLADKTRRGMRGRVEAGKSGGGKSYGYEVIKQFNSNGTPIRGERKIIEEEAEIIRRIFKEYALGKSPRAIAVDLNKEQIPGPNGKNWGPSTINGNRDRGTGILNNEIYIGRLIWNRLRYIKDPMTGKRVSRLNPEAEWVIKDVPELTILSNELWEQAKTRQGNLNKHRSDKKAFWTQKRPAYLFSGLLKCVNCGGGYTTISKTSLGCATARNKGTCNNLLTIKRDVLEATILDGLRNHLMDPDYFEVFCKEFTKEYNRLNQQAQNQIQQKQKQLQKTEQDIQNVIQAIKDGVPALSLKDELINLEASKADLKAYLDQQSNIQPILPANLATTYRKKSGAIDREPQQRRK